MTQSPQNIRTINRRKEQAKWRRSKEWKKLVEDHAHTPDAICEHCLRHHGELRKNGKPTHLTINHTSRLAYANKETYCTWNPQWMEVCCTTCNWMYEKGKKSCPVCHNAYIHAMEPDNMCQSCWDKAHPVEAQKRRDDREVKDREKKALLKMLREDQKAKAKKWKQDHPQPKSHGVSLQK